MKIALFGTGAIGGYIGARLAAGGADVTFIARGANLAAIRASGLRVTSPFGDLHAPGASATDNPETVGPVDLVLLATKLYDVESAARAIRPMLRDDTGVVCLQNGIDSPSIIDRLHDAGRAIGSVVMVNAQLAEPGLIRHNAMNGLIVGELDGRKSDRLSRLVELAAAGGLEARVSTEIRLEMWRKFLLIASMGAMSALTRVPLGRIREWPETWALTEQAMREVAAVAAAEGVPLGEEDVQRTLALMKGAPPTLKASLLTDLEQGRPLELEWLSGTICRLGAAHHVDTPFHRFTAGILKPHAAGTRG